MKTLTHSSVVLPFSCTITTKNIQRVKALFLIFNAKFLQEPNSDNSFTVNTGLDINANQLSDVEFQYAVQEAKEQGWKLTQFEDNYTTTTYKLEKI